MANKNLTIDMITLKALDILENKLTITKNVNRQYDSAYAQSGAKIGSSLRIRLPDRVTTRRGAQLQVQDRNEQFTNLRVDQQYGCDVAFSSAEASMEIDKYAENILEPRMSQVAADIDKDVAGLFTDIAQSVGTPGTTPNGIDPILLAGQKLNEGAAPLSNRYGVYDPAATAATVKGLSGNFNPRGKIDSQYSNAQVANDTLGFDAIDMSQSIRKFTTGSRASVGGSVAANVTQGAAMITLTGLGANAIVARGDVFTIAGVYAVNPQTRESTGSLAQFAASATVQANGAGLANIPVLPAVYDASDALATVSTLPVAGAAVVFMGAPNGTYPQNLFYNRDAIAFATADLVLPNGQQMASRKVYNGISLRVVQGYDINNDVMPCRIDILCGYGVIRPELAVRVWG